MMNEIDKPKPGVHGFLLVIQAIFAFFFYKYAFMNPDEGSCFAKAENKTAYGEIPMITTGSGEDAVQTQEEGFIEISKKF